MKKINTMTNIYLEDIEDAINTIEIMEGFSDEINFFDPLQKFIASSEEEEEALELLRALDEAGFDIISSNTDSSAYCPPFYNDFINEFLIEDYIREDIEDCYNLDLPQFVYIDWSRTIKDCLIDYLSISVNGVEYFYKDWGRI